MAATNTKNSRSQGRKIAKAIELRRNSYDQGYRFGTSRVKRFEVHAKNKITLDGSKVRKHLILLGQEKEQALMEYNLLRTQVNNAMMSSNGVVLAVTSARPSEGKSVTAINLALSLSRSVAKDIVLIDFDLHRPTVHKKLELDNEAGLSDYYLGKSNLQDIVLQDENTGLFIVPGREELANASDLIGKRKTEELFKDIRHAFSSRLVILDTPPALIVDDVSALLSHIDKVLFVVSEGKSQKEELKQALDLIGRDRIVGSVLNNSKESKRKKSTYYGHYSK